ncbi:MAG TPA: FAD-dependent oxidoreductase [Burkholderiaceae bacterium]|nr:FAD-dependent oxidoreductase [Burkholderiaceae bacterium]
MSLSRKPERRFWGWGYRHETIAEDELRKVQALLALVGASGPALPEPRVDDFRLPAPRGSAPAALASMLSGSAYDRLTHCCGKSFADGARMWARVAERVPDWVAYPDNEAQVVDLLDWASGQRIAVVPFGGGTSVVGGVEPIVSSEYDASVALDLERLDRVLEIDRTSRAARIQAGVLGPDLEAQLREHGLTLRHSRRASSSPRSVVGSRRARAATTRRWPRTSTTSSKARAWSRRPERSPRAACRHRVPARRPTGWCSAQKERSASSPRHGCACRSSRAFARRLRCASPT